MPPSTGSTVGELMPYVAPLWPALYPCHKAGGRLGHGGGADGVSYREHRDVLANGGPLGGRPVTRADLAAADGAGADFGFEVVVGIGVEGCDPDLGIAAVNEGR
jgi:hypothetical protein